MPRLLGTGGGEDSEGKCSEGGLAMREEESSGIVGAAESRGNSVASVTVEAYMCWVVKGPERWDGEGLCIAIANGLSGGGRGGRSSRKDIRLEGFGGEGGGSVVPVGNVCETFDFGGDGGAGPGTTGRI